MNKLNIIFFGMNGDFSIIPLLKIFKYHNVIAIIESLPRNYEKKEDISYLRKIKSRMNNFRSNSLEEIAKKNNIPHYRVKTVNTTKMEEIIKSLNPDLICVASFSVLIKKNIIDIPKYGIINFHPTYLPNYRGANPWVWMYYNMEQYGGVTIHYIDEGEDSGDIIYQEKYKIDLEMKLNDMLKIAIEIGSNLMVKAINDIVEKKVESFKQMLSDDMTRAARVDDMEKMIDWQNWDVKRVYHFLYGLNDNYQIVKSNKKYNDLLVNRYIECKIDKVKYTYGNIYNEKNLYFIPCKDGKIFIKYKFNFYKFIKGILI